MPSGLTTKPLTLADLRMTTLFYPLPYRPNSADFFARIADLPWPVFLDSGKPGSEYGRYDFLAADPFIKIETDMQKTVVCRRSGPNSKSTSDWQANWESQVIVDKNPFDVLNTLLADYPNSAGDLPFEGGAIGFFSYDLARLSHQLPVLAQDDLGLPLMRVGIYDWVLVVDHMAKQCALVSHVKDPATLHLWQDLCRRFEGASALVQVSEIACSGFSVTGDVQSNLTQAAYNQAFHQVKQYIREGDCYQINLAQRFSIQASGDPWLAYRQLRLASPAPFMVFMDYGDMQILSGSPERFLQVKGDHVETRPIKGTRPRAQDAAQDRMNAEELRTSQKDRAENVMIVDLLRNDIGKNCQIGSVQAHNLFCLESFSNVHHLVSTVTGKLGVDKTALDLLAGCFPGGSITGAPKLRAMQIIESLEPHRRGVYCGAIGYIGYDGNMDTNIAIRTAVFKQQTLTFWAGGGIVADSDQDREYEETLNKASSMLELVNFFKMDRKG